MPIEETKRYVRVRIRNPKDFKKGGLREGSTFVTKDPGRTGYTKLVVGKPKKGKGTRVQSVLFSKADFGRKEALRKAKSYKGRK